MEPYNYCILSLEMLKQMRFSNLSFFDFIFLSEDDGTYSVYKNRYNGISYTKLNWDSCVALMKECSSIEKDTEEASTLP